MSDEKKQTTQPEESPKVAQPEESPKVAEKEVKKTSDEALKLEGLFAFKIGMTSLFDKNGKMLPVTGLRYKPWKVSQIKTKDKEGYSAVQLASVPQKNKRCSKPLVKHLEPAGFKEGARYLKEIRQDLPENLQIGQELSIESLKEGDVVRLSSRSKGRGFSGVIKRWGFHGGRASHGAKTHRKGGSIGQNTEPARVMPGRKMPGRYGFQVKTFKTPVVSVLPEEGIIFVKGGVPGSRNQLVSLLKVKEQG